MRRAKLLIQLRMLQLHEQQLECIREAIERRLPPDLLPPLDSGQLRTASGQLPTCHPDTWVS
jgi:hypothetical protein